MHIKRDPADRPRWNLSLALIAALAVSAGCDDQEEAGQRPEPAAYALTYAARGPQTVGHQVFELPVSEGAPRQVKAWYPGEGEEAEVVYPLSLKHPEWQMMIEGPGVSGRAAMDAPLLEGADPLPVVLFSHGFGLNPEWYAELVEHLAARGFVVIAPEHSAGEVDWLLASEASIHRPIDVHTTLDFVEGLNAEGGPWAGRLDLDRVALVGHSYGGFTALAAAGARFDLSAMEQACGALGDEDPRGFVCAPFVGRAEEMAELAGLNAVPEGLWPTQQDERIKAIVPIAGDAYLFQSAGLAEIDIPMMAIGGTEDFGTPWVWGAQMAFDGVSSARRLLVGLEGGNHFLPMNDCQTLPWIEQIEQLYNFACFDPAWAKADGLEVIAHFTTAFLLDTLTGDPTAAAALQAEQVEWPGVRYQAHR